MTNLEHGSFYCSLSPHRVRIDVAGFCVSLFILNQIDSALLLFVRRTLFERGPPIHQCPARPASTF